ncbi:MAG: hypothetical protein ACREM3_23105 [Candidatus Rokuibacteriota bacterium]
MTAFDRAPSIVIGETTRACALACVHCRAAAILWRHPDELTTAEGRALYRDPERLEGRCVGCEYRETCGGGRAGAWAATGNALARTLGAHGRRPARRR